MCVCVFHKSFKLLSSHTNIPLTKKVCRLSETQKIFKENIFPEVFIYFSLPLAHTILAVFICLIGADIQDSSMCDFFLNFLSEQNARTRLSSSQQYQPCGLLYIVHKQPLAHYSTHRNPDQFPFLCVNTNIHNE